MLPMLLALLNDTLALCCLYCLLFFLLWSALNETCYGQKTEFGLDCDIHLIPKAEIHSKILVMMTCSSVHYLVAKLLAIILILQYHVVQSRCKRKLVWSYGNVFILISGGHGINITKILVVDVYVLVRGFWKFSP